MKSSTLRSVLFVLLLIAVCASAAALRSASAARRIDALWNEKIASWQERALEAVREPASPVVASRRGAGAGREHDLPRHAATERAPGAATLRSEYETFRTTRRRALAADVTRWVQRESTHHYRSDAPGDDWPTIAETLDRNGDDCDGLELIAYSLLRDLGFGERSVYRAVVRRRSDSLHHMVTLWLEDPRDPWVIDPTGIMAPELMRLSEIPGWVPVKLFSETETFTPQRGRFPGKLTAQRPAARAATTCEPGKDAAERVRQANEPAAPRVRGDAAARG